MPSIREELDQRLYDIAMFHLSKLDAYVPGPVKKAGGTKRHLIKRYRSDPLFSVFGLDSPEYVAATLGGGTATSIHRKIGDLYEACVKEIFVCKLNQAPEKITYNAVIRSGDVEETRSADAYLQFDRLPARARSRVERYCAGELHRLTNNPQVTLIGVGMEIRHCYQTGDSKRTQADEAMARHFLVSGILPIMPLFCNQSNPQIIQRYRSVWVVKEGMDSYEMIRVFSGYDFFDFLKRNKRSLKKPVIGMLRSLSK